MTHTNHRTGTTESLQRDFVVLMMAHKGINDQGARAKLQRFFDLAWKRGAVNLGDGIIGNVHTLGYEGLYEQVSDRTIGHAVFRDPKTLSGFLGDLKEADLGLSVTVSGLFDITTRCCKDAGLRPHAYEFSGSVWGRVDRMPGEQHLEIMTMCGHGMVPAALLDYLMGKVRNGELTPQEASLKMTRQCSCGVFNPERAAEVIAAMAVE